MIYKYSGYLAALLDEPDAANCDALDAVVFTADDMMHWGIEKRGQVRTREHVPAARTKAAVRGRPANEGEAVRLAGRFGDVRRLNIASDASRFWVSLSTEGIEDDRFPIDVARYPIAEVTYRCESALGRPAWLWTYPGGVHFAALAATRRWCTVARCVTHEGVPRQVDGLTLRLYATTRTTEILEIQSVRFRAMSPRESEAVAQAQAGVAAAREAAPSYPILDEFLPLGTFMDAEVGHRTAQTLRLAFEEYWQLAFEDIAQHHHNAVALERAEVLSLDQMRTLLALAESHQIRLVPMYTFPANGPDKRISEFIDARIAPYADSPGVLAWHIFTPPSERQLPNLMKAGSLVEAADPNHPVAVLTQYPGAFGLVSRHFSVTGFAHYGRRAPWDVVDMLRHHLPVRSETGRPHQFWLITPGFASPSDTPDWNDSPEMRLMIHLAFANGVRGLFSYAYHNDPSWISGSCQRSLTGPFLAFSDLWAEVGHRMCEYHALAPLFLETQPEERLPRWFGSKSVVHARSQLPGHIPATAVYRLRGADVEVFCITSNDMSEMATENIEIAPRGTRGLAFFDLTDFVRNRLWQPMPRTRHLEMSPGQAHVILAAKPSVCMHWRDVIAARLLEEDRRQLGFGLKLARPYGLNTTDVEALAAASATGDVMADFDTLKQAGDQLLDLEYGAPALCEARSKLIEVRAVLCACDMVLADLLDQGRRGQARERGFEVVPVARELVQLRLEMRQGHGAKIAGKCDELAKRALQVLADIRAVS